MKKYEERANEKIRLCAVEMLRRAKVHSPTTAIKVCEDYLSGRCNEDELRQGMQVWGL